jgi:crotonobetainyl-CoA:carnitine CoA-transferase CaiB-like acyl-CoA transferase
MLSWLGATVSCYAERTGEAAAWAASGAMELTGRLDGPPLRAPGHVASAVQGALLATSLLVRVDGRGGALPDVRVLSERAAFAGLRRGAPGSAGGAFRVLRAADGWLGVNLARESDRELLPAWLEDRAPALEAGVARHGARELAERARLLGLPAAALPAGHDEQLVARGQTDAVRPFVLSGRARLRRWELPPTLVVDLSSLWAGPLCGHILTSLGARVVKVESVRRPDGARFGPRGFFDLLHAGQESVALDFATPEGRAALTALVDAADVVIEASRPRALRQMGINAEDALTRAEDKCWLSITAYGRTGPWANAVGFGDDTALAAGLLAFDPETGIPAPCGDAVADPMTGVNAALVAVACRMAGGRWLADLALREQVAAVLDTRAEPGGDLDVAEPFARLPAGAGPQLGAHTARVLSELGVQ